MGEVGELLLEVAFGLVAVNAEVARVDAVGYDELLTGRASLWLANLDRHPAEFLEDLAAAA